jgi:hypothetical protein
MTFSQRIHFFMPAWRDACKVHGWRESLTGMALVATRKSDWGVAETADLYQSVWSVGIGLAQAREEELTEEILRHAATLIATNDKARGFRRPQTSSKGLNNAETNHAVALFRLLADPDDMSAMTAWLHPEQAQKRGLIDQITRLAPLAKVLAMARSIHKVGDLEELTEAQLLWYIRELKHRRGDWQRQPAALAENEPF